MKHDTLTQTHRIDPGTEAVHAVAVAVERLGAQGIGQALARAVAVRYGRWTLDVLAADDYERVTREVQGIGPERAAALHRQVVRLLGPRAKGRRERLRRLQHDAFIGRLGLTGFAERAIREHFGEKATLDDIERGIRTDPYQLTDVEGVGFLRADRVAMAVGISRDARQRIEAGVEFQLSHQTEQDGHCYLERGTLTHVTALMLQQPEATVGEAVERLIRSRRIIADGANNFANENANENANGAAQLSTRLYPPSLWRAETRRQGTSSGSCSRRASRRASDGNGSGKNLPAITTTAGSRSECFL